MTVKIPENHRAEFDRAADLAIAIEKFTPSELAEALGAGVFSTSVMVGYMEKAELVTKGKGDDVRRARITLDEWEAIGKKIENYIPVPEKEEEIFVPETEDKTVVSVLDIVPEPIEFINKKLYVAEENIAIDDGSDITIIFLEDISAIYIYKGGFFKRGFMTFSPDTETPTYAKGRADTVRFKRKRYAEVRALAEKLADRLGVKLIEIQG